MSLMQIIGAGCFGTVIEWVLRFVLAHSQEVTVSSLGTIVSAVGGAAITALFDRGGDMFAGYSVGLACGFFLHVLLFDIDPKTGTVTYRKKKDI
ncbi:MAG: hypothetical protein WA071_00660 [Undibacterium umbellatum]|uniref:hypothetical protein n=1 Tax=Undibacterium umbellatum TaxID=2762300 RepID=UPI003BB6B535